MPNLKSSLRQAVYQAEKSVQMLRFASVPEPAGGWPALLGISFPKSGTHLLDQILLGFSRIGPFAPRLHSFYAEYEGETGISRRPDEGLAWLAALGARDVASAHLFARREAVERVSSGAFVPYFIYRDPRDVVVSHVFYVTEMESQHVHHAHYASLPDFDARLRASILGRPELEIEFPNIAQRFAPYMAWMECADVLKVRFEDLVLDRAGTLGAILDRLLARAALPGTRSGMLRALELAIDPKRSPTFRSGKTGEWKKYFTVDHARLFKSVAGDLLQRLGYESSDNW